MHYKQGTDLCDVMRVPNIDSHMLYKCPQIYEVKQSQAKRFQALVAPVRYHCTTTDYHRLPHEIAGTPEAFNRTRCNLALSKGATMREAAGG